ncbi:MAG TPA: glycosyltransferase [Thermoleophilaceae bacterium]
MHAAADQLLIQKYGHGAPEIFARLAEPSEVGGHAGVNRYLYEIYSRRPDLQQGYPQIEGDGAHLLVDWAYRFGRDEVPIPSELMPSDWLNEPSPVGAHAGVNRYLYLLHSRTDWLRDEFPDLANGDAERLMQWARTHGKDHDPVLRDLLAPPSPSAQGGGRSTPPAPTSGGVNVVGFLRGELGLGEAARRVIAGLDAAGVPVLPVGQSIGSSPQQLSYASVSTELASFDLNLVCLNADQHARLHRDPGSRLADDRYTIGWWWWEVAGSLSVEWRSGFSLVDEVWAGSDHVAGTIAEFSPVPVRKMKVAVAPSPVPRHSRERLGLPQGFLFLTMFDYDSTVQRKNPLGTIEAFQAAFAPGSGPVLVLKTLNAERHADKRERLVAAAAGRPDIVMLDSCVSAAEKNALLAACDCYVSLHRAEGFGLPLAEAMYLGKPTIATGYSGNLEFMNEDNSYLVGYSMTKVGIEAEPYYPAAAEWADPDLDEAAAAMRAVFEDRSEAARRASRAAAHIRREFSPEAAGAAMRERLEQLWSSADPAAAGAPSLTGLAQEVDRATTADERFRGPRGLARRMVLRLMRPFTHHQRQLNHELARGVAGLRHEAALTRALLLAEIRRRDAQLDELRAGLEIHTPDGR